MSSSHLPGRLSFYLAGHASSSAGGYFPSWPLSLEHPDVFPSRPFFHTAPARNEESYTEPQLARGLCHRGEPQKPRALFHRRSAQTSISHTGTTPGASGPGPWAPAAVPVLWAHLSQHADPTAARSTNMSDLGQRTPLAKPHSHRQRGENRQIRASLSPRSLVTLAITITCRTFTDLAAEDGAHLADVDFGGHSHMESTPLRAPRNP